MYVCRDFHEIEKTFGCYKNVLLHVGIQFMPAVFADTWSHAIYKVKKILNNREELILRSIKVLYNVLFHVRGMMIITFYHVCMYVDESLVSEHSSVY